MILDPTGSGTGLSWAEIIDASDEDKYAKAKSEYSKYLPSGWEKDPWGANILPNNWSTSNAKTINTKSASTTFTDYYQDLTSSNAALTAKTSKKMPW